jgi:hypothetical protein
MRWKHYLIYSIRLIEIISLILAPLLVLHPFNAYTKYSIGGGGSLYEFIGVEFSSLTICGNTEYYAIGLSYNGTNATLLLEIYNSTEYPNVENWTIVCELGFSGNQAYNYTVVCQVADAIINYWDNVFYLEGYNNLGFPLAFYVNQTTDQLVMGTVYYQADPGVIAMYVYPKGTTVYVYGWAYSYSEQSGEIYLNPGGRIFAYEIQFNNIFSAQGFSSEIMNVFNAWKNDVGANKLTYSYINDVLLASPDESPQTQGQIEQIAEEYGGTITDYVNYKVFTDWFSDLEDLAASFSNYLEDINNDWDAGFPTNVIVYENVVKIPEYTLENTPGITGDWLEDEDI